MRRPRAAHAGPGRRLRTRPRAGRIALAAAALLFALVAAAVLAGPQIVVSRGLLTRWVNHHPEKFLLEYDSATAWPPGHVHLRGLRIRAQDPNVQYFFRMEDARVSVSFIDLLARRFHATRVRASGLVFRLRVREEARAVSRAHEAPLPPIPGLPLEPKPTKEEKEEQETGRPWAIVIDGIVAEPATEIWIDLYRFRGVARVTGGFSIRPHEHAQVAPSAVDFRSGEVTLGDEPVLAGFQGRASATIDPFDPEKVKGDAVWPYIAGEFRVSGEVKSLAFLDHFLRKSPEPRLAGGGGKASVDVTVRKGIGTGSVDLVARGIEDRYTDAIIRADAAVRGRIHRWDFEHETIDLSGTNISLTRVSSSGKNQDSREWWGRFELDSAKVEHGFWTDLRAHCRDARPLFRLFDVELPGWAQGLLKLEGFEAKARVGLAPKRVEVRGLDAEGGKFHVAGDYSKRGAERDGGILVESGPLAVGVEMDGPKSKLKLLGARRWFEERRGVREASAKSPSP